ncbi:hypothetical protein NCC49_000311 [Naganishia albida]|nr:hypothetical protein NCC49_000311 [Naganishia albida]
MFNDYPEGNGNRDLKKNWVLVGMALRLLRGARPVNRTEERCKSSNFADCLPRQPFDEADYPVNMASPRAFFEAANTKGSYAT